MNPKQTVPIFTALAPLAPTIAPLLPGLLIGGAALLLLKWLLSHEDKEKPPETAPANGENSRNITEIAILRQIPAEIPSKPAIAPVPPVPRVVIKPPPRIPSVQKAQPPVLAPVAAPVIASVQAPPLLKKKFVAREDLETVFYRGTRLLSRTAAVTALKQLGFGKSAAYAALTPDGRFSDWLKIAPDGIISWTDGSTDLDAN